ncbi:peptide MFS transporter [soil metagenome]
MNIVIVAGVVITMLTFVPVFLQLRKHPRGLLILFFAEMWERFSYYGMRGILIFYLTQHFLFDDSTATAQYGAYTTLVYLLPLIGGILADRYLGTRKAIAFGALLLVAGHLTMAVESHPAQQVLTYHGQKYEFVTQGRGGDQKVQIKVGAAAYDFGPRSDGGIAIKNLPAAAPIPADLPKSDITLSVEKRDPLYLNVFYLALSLIIMGVGFLKANISSLVGQLYSKGDPRRDPGFVLYYYGINLGSFWAAILCGYLGQTVGWWAGVGLAGLGMLAGFVVFVLGRPLLQGKGEPPKPEVLEKKVAGPVTFEHSIYIAAILGLALIYVLVQHNDVVGILLGVGAVSVLAYVGFHLITKSDREERERTFLALFLVMGAVMFWTLFEQAGSSLNLFAQRNTDLGLVAHAITTNVFGTPVFIGTQAMKDAAVLAPGTFWIDMGFTASQTQSFNAGFILIGAPIFAALWLFLGARGRDPSPMVKFGLALAQVGVSFLLLVWGSSFHDAAFRVPLIFLAGTYLLQTTGELCLSPVGLSQISKLAPPVLVSTMLAVWFLANSGGLYAAAFIAKLAGTQTVGGQVLDPAKALATSTSVFATIGWAGIALGVVFLALSPFLKHWAHGANDTGPIPTEHGV